MNNINSEYFTNCDLHKEKCSHIFIHITETPECIRCHEVPKDYKV